MEAPPNYGAAIPRNSAVRLETWRRKSALPLCRFTCTKVAGIPTLNIADGIHPNPAGARIVEANLWRSLKPLVEKQPR
jgi:acyl-CoA thioesterase-1